jgi:hypothetical protein
VCFCIRYAASHFQRLRQLSRALESSIELTGDPFTSKVSDMFDGMRLSEHLRFIAQAAAVLKPCPHCESLRQKCVALEAEIYELRRKLDANSVSPPIKTNHISIGGTAGSVPGHSGEWKLFEVGNTDANIVAGSDSFSSASSFTSFEDVPLPSVDSLSDEASQSTGCEEVVMFSESCDWEEKLDGSHSKSCNCGYARVSLKCFVSCTSYMHFPIIFVVQ